jgi:DNA helicase-2/ATP-dependent DNA helicase PcrA
VSSSVTAVRVAAVLDALDPEQRAVAEALTGPVCVLAGAGTGKTRAITHRIAHGVLVGAYPAQHVLAVTFTARAAGELRSRLRALGAHGVQARTFHSAALRQLQFFWPTAIGGELPRLEASKAAQVAAAAARAGLRPGPADVRDLAAEIEWAKVSQVAPADYAGAAIKADRTTPAGLDPAGMAELYAGYEDVKAARGLIDMEDILLLTVGVLSENADVAERVRRQYRHLVVDEYQDVSPLQQRLLEVWAGNSRELCVVGDPNQTIYSFAGATPEYLQTFVRRLPGTTTVRLVRNYRSTPQVVELANQVLRAGAGVELRAQSPAGPAPTLTEHPDEPTEAEAVAAHIAALREAGVAASEIAVLFRTNAQSLAYEQALAERGVPFVLRGGEKFFARPEVKGSLLRLRGAARAAAVGTDPGHDLELSMVEQVRAVLADAGLTAGSARAAGAAGEQAESLAALIRVAEDLAAADPAADLAALVAELDTRAADSHVPVIEGVTLASLHAAKGLEWEAVFLVGLVEGMVPISYAGTPEAIEEERRLLYVGLTRARKHLELSWALSRSPGGRGNRPASRFLDPLRPSRSRPVAADRPAKAGKSARTRTCRECGRPLIEAAARKLGRCPDCPSRVDEALLDRLRSWRLDRARAQSLPAYCVFTDATLLAIAETEPAAPNELARISGVGAAKLARYGADVLAICAGLDPADAENSGEQAEGP